MSTINSWCGRICTTSLTVLIGLLLLDYKSNTLPLNGIYLILYILTVIISTVWLACYLIQKLLQQNQVFEYDFQNNNYLRTLKNVCRVLQIPLRTDFIGRKKKKFMKGSNTPESTQQLANFIDSIPLEVISEKPVQNIDDRIELLASDIEQRFISKWYKYISSDETFTIESKLLLESVIRRVLQVSVQVDSSKIACGILVIILKHLKEYRKAIKRSNRNGNSIQDVYRYCHAANKSDSALEYYTHRLTANVLKEFINWELWNSLPSRLLVAILAKRLTKYAIHHLSQPGFINYKLVLMFASEQTFQNLQLQSYSYVSLSDVNLSRRTEAEWEEETEAKLVEGSTPRISPEKEVQLLVTELKSVDAIDSVLKDQDSMIEKALTKMITQQTAPILQRAEMKDSESNTPQKPLTPDASCKNTPERKKPQEFTPERSEPVKIHSAKSASKRWNENDVGNVSIGQDLLAMDSSDIQGFSGRRLWGPSLTEHELDKQSHPLWDINEIFKDKDTVESEKDDKSSPKLKEKRERASPPLAHCLKTSTTNAASIITNTIKPIGNVTATTLHNIRDFQQTTVNNVSNATEKAIHKIGDLQDEAVGVVEGIFDFGMAGLRKGLRLTGLQDTLSDAQPKNKNSSHHPLQHQEHIKQSPKNVPKLVKLGHITSEDVKKSSQSIESADSVWINPIAKESPNGFENQMLFEKSPNTTDNLSDTSTVDARIMIPDIEHNSYLTESPEYEETADLASTISKLRSLLQQKSSESSLNTPAASPMPGDDRSATTLMEPQLNDAIKTDGGMQRFARTVTGMFNTFKGALPGNSEQTQMKNDQWIYIENETTETDLSSLLNSLLIERRDYCTVDTAYEAMDSLDLLTESAMSPTKKIHWENQTFHDELDDFDSTIPLTKALMDVLCECLMDTNCALKQEPVMKAFLVIAGRKVENVLNFYADKMLRYINKSIGPLPKTDNDVPLAMELKQMIITIEESLPYTIKNVFGESDIKTGLEFFISSLQSITINQDVVLQLFELICSQLIYASTQMSPTPSA